MKSFKNLKSVLGSLIERLPAWCYQNILLKSFEASVLSISVTQQNINVVELRLLSEDIIFILADKKLRHSDYKIKYKNEESNHAIVCLK